MVPKAAPPVENQNTAFGHGDLIIWNEPDGIHADYFILTHLDPFGSDGYTGPQYEGPKEWHETIRHAKLHGYDHSILGAPRSHGRSFMTFYHIESKVLFFVKNSANLPSHDHAPYADPDAFDDESCFLGCIQNAAEYFRDVAKIDVTNWQNVGATILNEKHLLVTVTGVSFLDSNPTPIASHVVMLENFLNLELL